ncbi:hypothetical protein ACIQMY_35235 [Streptomyces sp. NPDC091368]|uniref:hypothetical protein n=1 Tax=Streptomyces sp. NPDC091368 TaxID=3365993 RepID=UPI0038058684
MGWQREGFAALDGIGCCYFGHDPSSAAERAGDTVRLTFDAHAKAGSPVIDLPVDQVRALVTGAQADLRDFHSLAGTWAEQHLPIHAAAVTAALARALDLGIGEVGIVGTAAAIVNAVHHACGVRIRALPLTPDRLLPLLNARAPTP